MARRKRKSWANVGKTQLDLLHSASLGEIVRMVSRVGGMAHALDGAATWPGPASLRFALVKGWITDAGEITDAGRSAMERAKAAREAYYFGVSL